MGKQCVKRNINKVESVQRNTARVTCRDYRRTSSVTAMLQKLRWDSLQERGACSRVLMLYRIRNGLIHIPAAAYLEPIPICTRRFETRYVQIQCNTGTYSQTFFPSAIRLWNTLPVDICQLSPDSFKTHLNSFRFIWAPAYVLFFSSAPHCCYPKLLFIACCTAFSIHICLFTRGATLLGIESAVGAVIGRWRWYKAMERGGGAKGRGWIAPQT